MRTLIRLMTALAMTSLALAPVVAPVDAQVAPGTSDAGVVPFVPESGQGGNVACTDLEVLDGIAGADLRTSGRLNWGGSGFDAPLPDGVAVTVTGGTVVAWTSTDFPLAAVIVKGSNAANVYDYTGLGDDVFADGGLVAPENASGEPAGLSNLTLCWDAGWTPPPPDEPNLTQLCLQAAEDAGIVGITWVTDPVVIEDGVVDTSTVPAGFMITFDGTIAGGQVAFAAPDPVAMVITAASVPAPHPIDPPSRTGTVPLSASPGDGEVVLCGIVEPIELSCEEVPDVIEVGPVPIVAGEVVTALVPDEIVAIVPNTIGIEFVAEVPVAAVVVAASEPELIPFDPPVLDGEIPVVIADEEFVEILFCVRSLSDTPDDPDDLDDPDDPLTTTRDPNDPTDDVAVGTLDDPTAIPTGGGPSGRTALALIAFVVLALAGSTTLLVWSRGG